MLHTKAKLSQMICGPFETHLGPTPVSEPIFLWLAIENLKGFLANHYISPVLKLRLSSDIF